MSLPKHPKIAIVGAGAWGTALANAASAKAESAKAAGDTVLLWGRDAGHMAGLASARQNTRHLPGIALHKAVQPTALLADLADADVLLVVVPTQSLRGVLLALKGLIPAHVPLVVCAKGIEQGTGLFVTQIVAEVLPAQPVAILSGPSFAVDVARGLPTAVTLAAADLTLAARLAEALSSPAFRLYHTGDVRGVEIGGAAKNVLAIGCGIAAGLGLGASASAALVARGFAELSRFGRVFGGQADTLMGLSGLGDLVLTCGSAQSRNFALGLALGRGQPLASAGGAKLAEGALTAAVLVEMAGRAGTDMPIATQVDAVLRAQVPVCDAVEALLARPQKPETDHVMT